jgi:hypothetical protein
VFDSARKYFSFEKQMKQENFFSCENIAVISSKALHLYPEIEKYVVTLTRPVNSTLFFSTVEPFVTKDTFNNSTPNGFASIISDKVSARITVFLGVDNRIKNRLINYIANFFTIPLVIEVDITTQTWTSDIDFLTQFGFGSPEPNANSNAIVDLQLTYKPSYLESVNKIMSISMSSPTLCKIQVHFPQTLARTLSSYLSKKFEVGGKICITRYTKTYDMKDIAVLGFVVEKLVEGDSNAVDILPSDMSPFSFHTHPDVALVDHKMFLGWPSAIDITTVLMSYITLTPPIVAHFVATSEGVWIIHVRPQFQKILIELRARQASEKCIIKLREFILKSYGVLETYRSYELVKPHERASTRQKFINVSKNLKLSDFVGTEVETECTHLITDDALLFDIHLIKWDIFESNKVTMSFSYLMAPGIGLECKLPVDCGVVPMIL